MKQQVDLFTPIHKAIRAMLYQLGAELQSADLTDQGECKTMLDKLENCLELLEEHARHEDEIIFPGIDQACPGITHESHEEHMAYTHKVDAIREVITAIRNAQKGQSNTRLTAQLRFIFADFIAFYLLHMNHEEEALIKASIDHLTPEELMDIRLKVQMDTSPERYTEWLHWMLPAMDLSELAPLFNQVKQNAPDSVFRKFQFVGVSTIPEDRWSRLNELVD
ncbi:MAG: hemerythrin domain-containing protein [Marinoscillum sp.]|uniref:hemerythrin domain-containing protein n=1 Tax=Marinoscillum sp. TaxID=2024838 RepID=UPI0032FB3C5B